MPILQRNKELQKVDSFCIIDPVSMLSGIYQISILFQVFSLSLSVFSGVTSESITFWVS